MLNVNKLVLISTALILAFGCTIPQSPSLKQKNLPDQTAPIATRLPTVFKPIPTRNLSNNHQSNLVEVARWFYYLDTHLDETLIEKISTSSYDLLVIDPIVTESGSEAFPIAETVSRWQNAEHPKLVVAYIDIAEAEDWRTYWQPDWRVGNPEWIIAQDPEGWEGDYPVAYWEQDWQQIWLGENGYLDIILEAGFDGIYLDWVEAYSDESVSYTAALQNISPRKTMVNWVGELADYARLRKPGFIIIAQNASDLIEEESYLASIDAISQEQIWFDGGADNRPPGDCPLPGTEADVESPAYISSLPLTCLEVYLKDPEGTLHTSSQEYLFYLTQAFDQGKCIFTVDYAQKPENIGWVYQTSRAYGFIPFVGERSLSEYMDPFP